MKSSLELPIKPSVALEAYLEESKTQLEGVKIFKPKTDFPHRERQAIKEIEQNTNIGNVKRPNKWTTTVIMNKEDKKREGQVLLDQRENYESLALPMVTEISRRVKEIIKGLYREMAIANAKSTTKSSFLYGPYKDTQAKPGRKTNHIWLCSIPSRRSWVRFQPRSKHFFFASCGSLFPFTRANAQ